MNLHKGAVLATPSYGGVAPPTRFLVARSSTTDTSSLTPARKTLGVMDDAFGSRACQRAGRRGPLREGDRRPARERGDDHRYGYGCQGPSLGVAERLHNRRDRGRRSLT